MTSKTARAANLKSDESAARRRSAQRVQYEQTGQATSSE
jgi:hypothetical protein